MAMQNWISCAMSAVHAAGRDLSDAELDRIFTRAQGRARRYQNEGMSPRDAAARAGDELGTETRTAAAIERRSAAENHLKQQALFARLGDKATSKDVRAMLTGVEGARRDQARSIDAERHGIHAQLVGPMVAELRAAGLLDALKRRDRAFERDIAREMWRVTDPSARATGNRAAEQAAAILHRTQDRGRLLQNDAGAWIGQAEHYVVRQSHDMLKVRGAGDATAFQAWRDMIEPRLAERSFDGLAADTPAARTEFLRATWAALADGVHDTATGSEWLTGFKGPANMAKKASQERVLWFRDADAFMDYNERFGKGGIVDGVLSGVEHSARNAAVMRTLGTNPEAMFRHVVDTLRNRAHEAGDFGRVDGFGKAGTSANDRILDVVTGKANIPGNATLASIGSGVRNLQQLAKLGGVVLSSLPDVVVAAAALRHNGVPLWEGLAHQVHALVPFKGAARREVADHLAVGVDGTLSRLHSRFRAEDGIPGRMASMIEGFHRFTLLTQWTDSMKGGMGDMLSHNLARRAGAEFGALPSLMQTTLRRYGIEAAEWEAIRQAPQRAADGRHYLLPHLVEQMDDAAVAHLGGDAAAAKADLARKVQTYIIDQVREGMTEPTAGVRAMAVQGQAPGTVAGEGLRMIMQFKSFMMTHIMRSLNREFRRDGVNVGGAATLIVGTTLMGYVSMTLKELAKGRDIRRPDDAGDWFKLASASMVQGGGLGIYGDFLFGEANRMGGGFLATLAGPTLGEVDGLFKVLTAARDGTSEHGTAEGMRRGGVEAFQFAKGNTPFINLFYTRAALDYMVFFKLQEEMNPGYLQRYERRAKAQQNQTFWLRPTQPVVPQLARMVGLD